jgi:hypothetical protein
MAASASTAKRSSKARSAEAQPVSLSQTKQRGPLFLNLSGSGPFLFLACLELINLELIYAF